MKRASKNSAVVVSLASFLAGINCGGDENPLAPSRLAGKYTLVSFADTVGNITVNAGDIADLDGPGALPEGAITGSLELTETTSTFTYTITPIGAPPTTVIGTGTYTISGSAITFRITESTITETVPVGTDTLTFMFNGSRLTMEDDEKRFIYDKQ